MDYIIIDLEWNQGENTGRELPVSGIPFEIIEIGAVKLDENREYKDTFHALIKPSLYKRLHPITKDLTGISQDELKKGRPFKDVISDFLSWCGSGYTFCTWGSGDITELQRNMNFYGIPLLSFPVYYYDLQKIFSIAYDDGKIRRSLEAAVEHLNIPQSQSFHRALADALYTSKIFSVLDNTIIKENYSIDTYQIPYEKHNEIYAFYPLYSKYISRGFENKTKVMEDKSVTAVLCCKCGKKLKKKVKWFSSNAKTYYFLGVCPTHGWLKGKIRMKRHDSGVYYAVKTIKLTDEKGAAEIYEKQTDIRKRRRERRKKLHSSDQNKPEG